MVDRRQLNQRAFRKLKSRVDETYPADQFIAICDGKILADAADLNSLRQRVAALGKAPSETLVFQAGVQYPENATIFV